MRCRGSLEKRRSGILTLKRLTFLLLSIVVAMTSHSSICGAIDVGGKNFSAIKQRTSALVGDREQYIENQLHQKAASHLVLNANSQYNGGIKPFQTHKKRRAARSGLRQKKAGAVLDESYEATKRNHRHRHRTPDNNTRRKRKLKRKKRISVKHQKEFHKITSRQQKPIKQKPSRISKPHNNNQTKSAKVHKYMGDSGNESETTTTDTIGEDAVLQPELHVKNLPPITTQHDTVKLPVPQRNQTSKFPQPIRHNKTSEDHHRWKAKPDLTLNRTSKLNPPKQIVATSHISSIHKINGKYKKQVSSENGKDLNLTRVAKPIGIQMIMTHPYEPIYIQEELRPRMEFAQVTPYSRPVTILKNYFTPTMSPIVETVEVPVLIKQKVAPIIVSPSPQFSILEDSSPKDKFNFDAHHDDKIFPKHDNLLIVPNKIRADQQMRHKVKHEYDAMEYPLGETEITRDIPSSAEVNFKIPSALPFQTMSFNSGMSIQDYDAMEVRQDKDTQLFNAALSNEILTQASSFVSEGKLIGLDDIRTDSEFDQNLRGSGSFELEGLCLSKDTFNKTNNVSIHKPEHCDGSQQTKGATINGTNGTPADQQTAQEADNQNDQQNKQTFNQTNTQNVEQTDTAAAKVPNSSSNSSLDEPSYSIIYHKQSTQITNKINDADVSLKKSKIRPPSNFMKKVDINDGFLRTYSMDFKNDKETTRNILYPFLTNTRQLDAEVYNNTSFLFSPTRKDSMLISDHDAFNDIRLRYDVKNNDEIESIKENDTTDGNVLAYPINVEVNKTTTDFSSSEADNCEVADYDQYFSGMNSTKPSNTNNDSLLNDSEPTDECSPESPNNQDANGLLNIKQNPNNINSDQNGELSATSDATTADDLSDESCVDDNDDDNGAQNDDQGHMVDESNKDDVPSQSFVNVNNSEDSNNIDENCETNSTSNQNDRRIFNGDNKAFNEATYDHTKYETSSISNKNNNTINNNTINNIPKPFLNKIATDIGKGIFYAILQGQCINLSKQPEYQTISTNRQESTDYYNINNNFQYQQNYSDGSTNPNLEFNQDHAIGNHGNGNTIGFKNPVFIGKSQNATESYEQSDYTNGYSEVNALNGMENDFNFSTSEFPKPPENEDYEDTSPTYNSKMQFGDWICFRVNTSGLQDKGYYNLDNESANADHVNEFSDFLPTNDEVSSFGNTSMNITDFETTCDTLNSSVDTFETNSDNSFAAQKVNDELLYSADNETEQLQLNNSASFTNSGIDDTAFGNATEDTTTTYSSYDMNSYTMDDALCAEDNSSRDSPDNETFWITTTNSSTNNIDHIDDMETNNSSEKTVAMDEDNCFIDDFITSTDNSSSTTDTGQSDRNISSTTKSISDEITTESKLGEGSEETLVSDEPTVSDTPPSGEGKNKNETSNSHLNNQTGAQNLNDLSTCDSTKLTNDTFLDRYVKPSAGNTKNLHLAPLSKLKNGTIAAARPVIRPETINKVNSNQSKTSIYNKHKAKAKFHKYSNILKAGVSGLAKHKQQSHQKATNATKITERNLATERSAHLTVQNLARINNILNEHNRLPKKQSVNSYQINLQPKAVASQGILPNEDKLFLKGGYKYRDVLHGQHETPTDVKDEDPNENEGDDTAEREDKENDIEDDIVEQSDVGMTRSVFPSKVLRISSVVPPLNPNGYFEKRIFNGPMRDKQIYVVGVPDTDYTEGTDVGESIAPFGVQQIRDHIGKNVKALRDFDAESSVIAGPTAIKLEILRLKSPSSIHKSALLDGGVLTHPKVKLKPKVHNVKILNPTIQVKSTTTRAVHKIPFKNNITKVIVSQKIADELNSMSGTAKSIMRKMRPRVHSKNFAHWLRNEYKDEKNVNSDHQTPNSISEEISDKSATSPRQATPNSGGDSPQIINDGLAGKLLNTSCLVFISTDQAMLDQLRDQYTNMPNTVVGNINKASLNASNTGQQTITITTAKPDNVSSNSTDSSNAASSEDTTLMTTESTVKENPSNESNHEELKKTQKNDQPSNQTGFIAFHSNKNGSIAELKYSTKPEKSEVTKLTKMTTRATTEVRGQTATYTKDNHKNGDVKSLSSNVTKINQTAYSKPHSTNATKIRPKTKLISEKNSSSSDEGSNVSQDGSTEFEIKSNLGINDTPNITKSTHRTTCGSDDLATNGSSASNRVIIETTKHELTSITVPLNLNSSLIDETDETTGRTSPGGSKNSSKTTTSSISSSTTKLKPVTNVVILANDTKPSSTSAFGDNKQETCSPLNTPNNVDHPSGPMRGPIMHRLPIPPSAIYFTFGTTPNFNTAPSDGFNPSTNNIYTEDSENPVEEIEDFGNSFQNPYVTEPTEPSFTSPDSLLNCDHGNQGMATIKLPPLSVSDAQRIMSGEILNVTCMIYVSSPTMSGMQKKSTAAYATPKITVEAQSRSNFAGDFSTSQPPQEMVVNRTKATIVEVVGDFAAPQGDGNVDNQMGDATGMDTRTEQVETFDNSNLKLLSANRAKCTTNPLNHDSSQLIGEMVTKINENRNAPAVEFKFDLKSNELSKDNITMFPILENFNSEQSLLKTEDDWKSDFVVPSTSSVISANDMLKSLKFGGFHSTERSLKDESFDDLQGFSSNEGYKGPTYSGGAPDDQSKAYNATCQIIVESPNSIKIVGPSMVSDTAANEFQSNSIPPPAQVEFFENSSDGKSSNPSQNNYCGTDRGNQEINEDYEDVNSNPHSDEDMNGPPKTRPCMKNENSAKSLLKKPHVSVDSSATSVTNTSANTSLDVCGHEPADVKTPTQNSVANDNINNDNINNDINNDSINNDNIKNDNFNNDNNNNDNNNNDNNNNDSNGNGLSVEDSADESCPDNESGMSFEGLNQKISAGFQKNLSSDDFQQMVKTIAGTITECLEEYVGNVKNNIAGKGRLTTECMNTTAGTTTTTTTQFPVQEDYKCGSRDKGLEEGEPIHSSYDIIPDLVEQQRDTTFQSMLMEIKNPTVTLKFVTPLYQEFVEPIKSYSKQTFGENSMFKGYQTNPHDKLHIDMVLPESAADKIPVSNMVYKAIDTHITPGKKAFKAMTHSQRNNARTGVGLQQTKINKIKGNPKLLTQMSLKGVGGKQLISPMTAEKLKYHNNKPIKTKQINSNFNGPTVTVTYPLGNNHVFLQDIRPYSNAKFINRTAPIQSPDLTQKKAPFAKGSNRSLSKYKKKGQRLSHGNNLGFSGRIEPFPNSYSKLTTMQDVNAPVPSQVVDIPSSSKNSIKNDTLDTNDKAKGGIDIGTKPRMQHFKGSVMNTNKFDKHGKVQETYPKIVHVPNPKKPTGPDGAIINNDDIRKINDSKKNFEKPKRVQSLIQKNSERPKINSYLDIYQQNHHYGNIPSTTAHSEYFIDPRVRYNIEPVNSNEAYQLDTTPIADAESNVLGQSVISNGKQSPDDDSHEYTFNRNFFLPGNKEGEQSIGHKQKIMIQVTPGNSENKPIISRVDVQRIPNPENFFDFKYPVNKIGHVRRKVRAHGSGIAKVLLPKVSDIYSENDISFRLPITEKSFGENGRGTAKHQDQVTTSVRNLPVNALNKPAVRESESKQSWRDDDDATEAAAENAGSNHVSEVNSGEADEPNPDAETRDNLNKIVGELLEKLGSAAPPTDQVAVANGTASKCGIEEPSRSKSNLEAKEGTAHKDDNTGKTAGAMGSKNITSIKTENETVDQSKLWDTNLSPLEVRETQAKNMKMYMDASVNPCTDFYSYACGNWHKYHPIPPDHGGFDTFEMLRENLDLHLRKLLENAHDIDMEDAMLGKVEEDKNATDLYNFAPNQTVPVPYFEEVLNSVRSEFVNPIRKAKFLYNSCMQENFIKTRGDKPLLHLLHELRGWPVLENSWDHCSFDLIWLLGQLRLYNNDLLVSEWIGPDIKNSDEYVIQLDQTSLGLPSREYFLSETSREYIESYHQFLLDVVRILGAAEDQSREDVKDIIEFEIKLATITADPEDRRNLTSIYARLSLGELQVFVPQFDWIRYFEMVAERELPPTTPIVCYCMSYLQELVNLISQTRSRTLANYLLWRFVRHRVNNLDDRYMNAKQKFYHLLFGREASPPRWQFCVAQVNSNLGMALGNVFVNTHFDEKSKNDTVDMTKQLEVSFKNILMQSDWLDDSTRSIAIAKVDAMRLRIGYPDILLNKQLLIERYRDIKVHPDYYFENSLSILRHLTRNEHQKIGKMVDKNMWNTAPAVVNAYYSRNKNQIMFPAGILQPPFYHQYFPKALNYGGIGVVIGHEITHGFDDKGRLFDKDGNLNTWWSDDATEKFRDKAKCIVDQYNSFVVPEANAPLDGMTTQGENIADNGGIKQAFRAYQEWLKTHRDELLPGFNATNNQLFFLNFAQVWCGSSRPEAAKNRLKTAVHSPGRFRVIGTLRNSVEFATAYKCPQGSPMNPNNKCMVW